MITLLSLLFYIATTTTAENSRLLQVQIIIRHGDRAPMDEFVSAESAKWFPRGLGELTDEGIRHAKEQGAAFRKHYEELGLLNKRTKQSDIYIRSSPIKRVLMSATAFATTFIGKKRGRQPAIFTTENEEDEKVLVVHDSLDHRCKVLARHNITDQPLCRAILLKAEIVKEFPECASFPYTTIEAAIAQIENPAVKLDSKLERCARGDGRKIQLRSLSIRPGVGSEFDEARARAVIGPLLSITSKNVDDAVKADTIEGAKTGPIVRVYYTHDHNILAVAQAIGVIGEFEGRNPEFSSAIVIETWSSSEGFDIKIVMKDGVNASFKPVAKFRFLDFKKRIASYTEVEQSSIQWDDQVDRQYTFAEFSRDAGIEVTSTAPIIPRVRTSSKDSGGFTCEILLVSAMLIAVVFVLVRRRNKYTRMY